MEPVIIRRTKKEFFDGTHRVLPPDETYRRIEPLMERIGVTELVDITPFDSLGIPVYSALRPSAARGSVAVHAGKGKDPLQAKVSAMMEAIERFSGEYHGEHMEFAGFEEIGIKKAVDPKDLILPRQFQMGERIYWTPSWDLLNEEERFIPSNAVFHPYLSMGTEPLFRSDTNGLAGGNALEEAILHGILEVIERDALSSAERSQTLGKRILIDRDGPARTLQEIFLKQDIVLHLWLLNGRTGIPTVAAAADDLRARDPGLLVTGSGSHTCPEIAVIRALTEVAQSRASYLYGGRTDPMREQVIQKAGYERLKRINRMWFSEGEEEVALSRIPDHSTEYIDEDIRVVLQEVERHAESVCMCDLSQTAVPVVRIVIPGFEVSYIDRSRTRPRNC
jgi:putative methanogenesis marker protein 1